MFDRDKMEQLRKTQRERIIANGRARFIRREIGLSILSLAMVVTVLYFVHGRTSIGLVAAIGVLPIGVLGGYLHAIWKWQDILKSRS